MSAEPTTPTFQEILDSEEGHSYAYGGGIGAILAIVLIVLLLVWLF